MGEGGKIPYRTVRKFPQCGQNGGLWAFSWCLSLRDSSQKPSALTVFVGLFFRSSSLWLDTQVFVHGLHNAAHLFKLCFRTADLCSFLGELLELCLDDLAVVTLKLIHAFL